MGINLKRLLVAPALAAAVFALGACVTINVYFPAAEAQEAAEEFVERVLGDEAESSPPGDQPQAFVPAPRRGFNPLSLLIGEAQAQEPDFNIQTPAIKAIQARMAQRFETQLRPHFDAGALGFTADGLVVVRDATALALKDRVPVNNAVADENRDRKAVYREIAVANGHPEWEDQIRSIFARQWVASARSGWWYQDGQGNWKQK